MRILVFLEGILERDGTVEYEMAGGAVLVVRCKVAETEGVTPHSGSLSVIFEQCTHGNDDWGTFGIQIFFQCEEARISLTHVCTSNLRDLVVAHRQTAGRRARSAAPIRQRDDH